MRLRPSRLRRHARHIAIGIGRKGAFALIKHRHACMGRGM